MVRLLGPMVSQRESVHSRNCQTRMSAATTRLTTRSLYKCAFATHSRSPCQRMCKSDMSSTHSADSPSMVQRNSRCSKSQSWNDKCAVTQAAT